MGGGIMRLKVFFLFFMLTAAAASIAADQPGNIDIRSTLVGARVYLDDAYVGDADIFLEDVPSGDHMILMRQGGQRIVGNFSLKPGEMLMLEGRFEEQRIVDLKQVAREEAQRRAETERKEAEVRKAEPEPKKAEPKKTEKKAEAKKAEPKKAVVVASAKTSRSAEEERRDSHVNLIRV